MRLGRSACSLGITALNCHDDVTMLLANNVDPGRIRQCRRTKQDQRIVQRAGRFQQEAVACPQIDTAVKILIERGRCLHVISQCGCVR